MAQRPEKKNSAKAKKTSAAKKSATSKKKASAKAKVTTQKKVEKVEKSTQKVTKSASKPTNKKQSSAPKKTVQKKTAKQSSNKKTERNVMNNKNHFDKFANDAADAGRKQMEALSKSGSIFWKGCEEILRECMSLAQDSTEKNSKMIQKLMSMKSMDEWANASNKMTQQSFDDAMASLTKISEMSVKIATDSFEPINDQVSKAVKKASEAMAA